MSDAVVSLLVSDVLWRLTSPAVKKFRLLRGLEDDISALRVTLEQIQAVLQDAEVKQKKLKAVETWLKTLRSVALEMENVLDEVASEASLHRLQVQRGVIYRARAFFSSNHNQIMVRYRITTELKNIRRKLDVIAANRSNFGLSHVMLTAEAGLGDDRKRRETSSLVSSSMIYGRDSETEMIIQKICNKDIVRRYVDDVRVYAIWGMGGVGKTTLAQLVYNHEKVRSHFNVKSWVHVSTEFDIHKLIRGIIESIDGFRCKLSRLDVMQVDLQNKLRGKKFLIVLDDVWTEERIKWDELSKALSCGTQDSVVMVTTRSQKISTIMAKVPDFLHKVGCLSEEGSWAIFKNTTFGVGREGEDLRVLEPIGMKIVKKCKGLPLAVKAMSSLMWSKTSVAEWERVNQSDIWELQQNEVHILPALEISYDNLLPHMKRCFAYCCMFPKGYEMTKDQVIQLWVANGFISSRGETDLYILGEEVFDCLVWMSFFQDVHDVRKRKSIDKVFIMHDLMHDLGRYVMRHECSVREPGKTSITPEEVLHISSTCADFILLDHDSYKLRSLRSIFIFANEYKGKISQIFEHRYLRVLHLIGIGETTLPESICELKHMRYLNLSGSNIHVLPKSIICLQNLQVLILNSCMELRNLPEGIRYMRKLEYLDIKNCYNLEGMPVGMKELTGLRRLSNFVVGKKNAARIGDLGDLNLLGGELEILALDYVKDIAVAKSANLKCKRDLIHLILSWSVIFVKSVTDDERSEKVLEGLEPNLNLQELEIRTYSGSKISPTWMAKLTNLVIIKFWYCERCTCIPPLGKLPNLKHIDMGHLLHLERFHDEDNTTSQNDALFPSLQELSIVGSYLLVSLPSNLLKLERLKIQNNMQLLSLPSNFPKLKELDVANCSGLLSLPDGLESLTHLTITGCESLAQRCIKEIGEDWPKICHVPNISIRV